MVGSHAFAFKIPEQVQAGIKHAASLWLRALLPEGSRGGKSTLEVEAALDAVSSEIDGIADITPNGLVVAKHETALEYNLYAKRLLDVVWNLGFKLNSIYFFDMPPNMRIKEGKESELNLSRQGPSELPHLDAWSNASPASCTIHIPIAGDISKNFVLASSPPSDFEESWMTPRAFRDGQGIADAYQFHEEPLPPGYGLLMDGCVMHKTFRAAGAGPRVSTDFAFTPRRAIHSASSRQISKEISASRGDQMGRFLPTLAADLGHKSFFQTANASGEFQSHSRKKHPADLTLVAWA